MRRVVLCEKVESIKAASAFQHKLIDTISRIMEMKRKAEFDYRVTLEAINRELQRYIAQDNGFLTDIVKSFQSYIAVIYQNQVTLIDGYDNEVLQSLTQAKQTQVQQELISKAQFFDSKMADCQTQLHKIKQLIKNSEMELQVIASEVKLVQRVGELNDVDKKSFGERYSDLARLKNINQQALEQHVDGMMGLTTQHDALLRELEQYQTVYLSSKGSQVFDGFMRAFVLQVSYIRSMQYDVCSVLQKVKERQEEHRKVALDALRLRMAKEGSKLKAFFWENYKRLTKQPLLDINEPYIPERIRSKWKQVCNYYNQAY